VAEWPLRLRRLRRRTLFLLVRGVIRRCRFENVRRIGAALGSIQYFIDGKTRRQCLAAMAVVQGLPAADPKLRQQLRSAYRVNTIAIAEVLWMVDRRLSDELLHQQCVVSGKELLLAARNGRGAILLANHSGNSLLLAAQLAAEGLPVTVVYRHARMMSAEFFANGLPRYGIEGILANEGFRAYARMLDALRHNRIVFAMMDQGVKEAETGIAVRFLGKDMPMPGGVVQLARQARAPIVPVITLAADPVWKFQIDAPIPLQAGARLEDDVATVLRLLEQQILARPELWSWHQRRWRKYAVASV
jgi:lauroyl/myristoyl acyltransferase